MECARIAGIDNLQRINDDLQAELRAYKRKLGMVRNDGSRIKLTI